MPRDVKVYLDDILDAIEKIRGYTVGLSFEEFCNDNKTFDAVVRNLEIIGEAAKNVDNKERKQYSKVEWRKIAGLRDILIHEYFGIDVEIVWDVVKNKLPKLAKSLKDG